MKNRYSFVLIGVLLLGLWSCKGTQKVIETSERKKPKIEMINGAMDSLVTKYPAIDHRTKLIPFLDQVKANVEQKDWGSIFAKCSKAHYKTQVVDMKISPTQYIAELFGLHRVDNSIANEKGKITYDELRTMQTINYQSIAFDGTIITIKGKALMEDGSEMDMEMMLKVDVNGEYKLTGAVG